MSRVYMFDNNTGIHLPEKIGVNKVNVLLGNNVSDIHKSIIKDSTLFCVFTKIKDINFIVPTEQEANILKEILKFGKYEYTVDFKQSSVWYSSNAKINIVISDNIDMTAEEISSMLSMYITKVFNDTNKNIKKYAGIYIVKNTRNSKIIHSTPDYEDAKSVCDKNPCTVIMKKGKYEVLYKSKYGKVAIPYTIKNTSSRFRNKINISIGI